MTVSVVVVVHRVSLCGTEQRTEREFLREKK